jgi:hypothetical protein
MTQFGVSFHGVFASVVTQLLLLSAQAVTFEVSDAHGRKPDRIHHYAVEMFRKHLAIKPLV